ncbi:MAG: 6,7-dimethyl-8-ribityllumazine synthase [Bacteroidia bacterium]
MSTANKNLSDFDKTKLPGVALRNFAIVVSEWNAEITEALYNGCYQTLVEAGVKTEHIKRINVPGSFELTSGARLVAEDHNIDAVICLGCVIQGETRHFDFICNAVANGLTQLCINYRKPFIFGLLTPNNMQQAQDRAGGKHGNKGVEAAVTAIKMVALF